MSVCALRNETCLKPVYFLDTEVERECPIPVFCSFPWHVSLAQAMRHHFRIAFLSTSMHSTSAHQTKTVGFEEVSLKIVRN